MREGPAEGMRSRIRRLERFIDFFKTAREYWTELSLLHPSVFGTYLFFEFFKKVIKRARDGRV